MRLRLRLPQGWLADHPLTREDLEREHEEVAEIGYALSVRSA